jgi:putative heme iron utilization protein
MSATPPDADPLLPLAALLVRTARAGVLSTLSAHHAGWPFGSLAPYAVAPDGALVLVLSDLAEHTRNLRADPRASLFVHDPAAPLESQAAARLCVLGRVSVLEGSARDAAAAAYTACHPEGAGYLAKLDFRVYGLLPEHVRLVGGFGRIAWLEGADLVTALRAAHRP